MDRDHPLSLRGTLANLDEHLAFPFWSHLCTPTFTPGCIHIRLPPFPSMGGLSGLCYSFGYDGPLTPSHLPADSFTPVRVQCRAFLNSSLPTPPSPTKLAICFPLFCITDAVIIILLD